MSIAVQKTITLIILILIGAILKLKIKEKSQLNGIKVVILSIALPATIFVALLKINIASNLFFIPLLALVFNILMFGLSKYLIAFTGFKKNSSTYRSILMLFPSLAPGLSCFPFIIEFLNDDALAHAALADVGNKIFVLIVLYIIAMKWYYNNPVNIMSAKSGNTKDKIKDMLLVLVKEPVNLVIISALLLLGIGYNIETLPAFLSQSALKISAMMTPLVLIFIGLAVRIKWQQFRTILSLLFLRSAFAFLISALILMFLPIQSNAIMLMVVIFPQSSCSFWPFAHMSAVNQLENKNKENSNRTFNIDFGLSMLACSLPFSSLLILLICTIGEPFALPMNLGIGAMVFIALALIPRLWLLNKKDRNVISKLKQMQH